MPQHGDYDQENLKWFCNTWIDKIRWLEIHGYAPISTNTESEEYEGRVQLVNMDFQLE